MNSINEQVPGKEPPYALSYFRGSMFEALLRAAKENPSLTALFFMGKRTSYGELLGKVQSCARSLSALGVGEDDKVTIAMPNCPQAICVFYAVNAVGGVANMLHPLSGEKELEDCIKSSGSKVVFTLDMFLGKFKDAAKNIPGLKIISASIAHELPAFKKAVMLLSAKKTHGDRTDGLTGWKDFIASGRGGSLNIKRDGNSPAVILYSGGTTGSTKGILLTNLNFNALAAQIIDANPMFRPGDRMLAAMPVFHGFGLGVCIHSMLANGGCCVLVPRFTPKSYSDMVVKNKCNFIAGVPTLYEAILRLPEKKKYDLSQLKGVFSGGDSLSPSLKKRFDIFLAAHGAKIMIREGYGTTESVTACCLTPPDSARQGSVGVAFTDMKLKIVRPGTDEELERGTEGEILISGPTVMKEYISNREETEKTLRLHSDGRKWVYTGDLGKMDEDGYLYFCGRIKRMIITSGYNVYPAQLENILDSCELVHMSCVIGVSDSYRVQAVKAFIVPAKGVKPSEETKKQILAYTAKYAAKYALPRQIEFREDLPKTLVGKVNYRALEGEEQKNAACQ